MADIKQIKGKIQATDNIKKITNALEIISTIKLQKIKHSTVQIRECMLSLLDIIMCVDKTHLLFHGQKSTGEKRLVIVLGSEKGLCGSLNTTLFKKIHNTFGDFQDKTDIYVVGKKAKEYFTRRNYTIVGSTSIGDNITPTAHRDVLTYIDTVRASGQYNRIYICYNVFKNTMRYLPVVFSLFPLIQLKLKTFLAEMHHEHLTKHKKITKKSLSETELLIEPSIEIVQEKLYNMMMHYIIYGAILQNKTCEFSARMLAMKGAKDNATSQITKLKLSYNKARQDGITKEIIEIAGAKAIVAG